jgi:hypothetical protein
MLSLFLLSSTNRGSNSGLSFRDIFSEFWWLLLVVKLVYGELLAGL